ncbi:predicted protein [Nematostella vectensis]|uniref:Tubulin delta chain n=2 Tax=Nematostella vectensis TaxID=45351 RepID=A7SA70_NEMVE|nr:predicted protein [Nematostella vectensis]|eukprot:XP_001631471.1 predicted protein [Nematostella vectensis]
MSIVTLQLGQCGNQIGRELFDLIVEDATKLNSRFLCKELTTRSCTEYEEESLARFFTRENDDILNARAVSIDMESKVISQTLSEASKSGTWRYPKGQQFSQKRGSGNNWAHGFSEHGPKSIDKVLDLVQREVEKCDRLDGFLTLLSLAGGTGSGVGAFVTNSLRDFYPNSFIVNNVVWPYSMGEVIVQNYNATLTLAQLYKSSDAIIIVENDKLQKICSKLLNLKHISFRDINKVVSHKLGSMLQPMKLFRAGQSETELGKTLSVSSLLADIVEQLCPHPDYKLLSLRSIPQMAEKSMAYSTYNWSGLLKHLRQMLIADASMEEGIDWEVRLPADGISDHHSQASSSGTQSNPPLRQNFNKSIANRVVMRGKDVTYADPSAFADPRLYVDWMPSYDLGSITCHLRPFNNYEKSVTLLSNSQTHVGPLSKVVGKAWTMFASRAYVHQYLRFGISEDAFVDSFACLEQVVKNYYSL